MLIQENKRSVHLLHRTCYDEKNRDKQNKKPRKRISDGFYKSPSIKERKMDNQCSHEDKVHYMRQNPQDRRYTKQRTKYKNIHFLFRFEELKIKKKCQKKKNLLQNVASRLS